MVCTDSSSAIEFMLKATVMDRLLDRPWTWGSEAEVVLLVLARAMHPRAEKKRSTPRFGYGFLILPMTQHKTHANQLLTPQNDKCHL
jgi:hypothetical protein